MMSEIEKRVGKCLVIVFASIAISGSIISCASPPELRPSPKDVSFIQSASLEKPRKICVFMDGTANSHSAQTNIRRIYELVSAKRGPERPCFYDVGVGAAELPLTGMAFGAGLSKNVMQAYAFVVQNYRGPQDKIYIFGYSRGARQAQILCDLIDECGIPSGEDAQIFRIEKSGMISKSRSFFRRYKSYISERRNGVENVRINNAEKLPPLRHSLGWPSAKIEFVGLFDCVESMANNVWRGVVRGDLSKGEYQGHGQYVYDLSANVKEAYHAMAMDEKRGLYEVIKWTLPNPSRQGQTLEQVWFAGGHGDVGGGYEESQSLSAIPLNWMISKLEKHRLVQKGYRVFADLRGPVSDTRNFAVGKALANFRRDRPRHESFWMDRYDSSSYPGSITRSIPVVDSSVPLVHESVYRRLTLPNLYRIGDQEIEKYGYRPWLLHKPQGFKISYGERRFPEFSYYSSDPKKSPTQIDLEKFRKDTKSVFTDFKRSKAGGF